MKRVVRRALIVGLLLTLGAGIALFASSGLRARILDAYVLAIGGVVMLALFRSLRVLAPSPSRSEFERAIVEMRAPPRESGELSVTRDVELSRANAFHYHMRVRPLLREIAAYRLRLHYGVELDREPERARELVGSDAWEVVRPDRLPPADRLARGPSVARQRRVIDELERL